MKQYSANVTRAGKWWMVYVPEATELAKALVDLPVPLRDVGTVLGVSHQRAHQLVSGGVR